MSDFAALPPDLPAPEDDGAADHLVGMAVPALALPVTSGGELNLAELATGRLVAYFYPRTGKPGEPLPDGWDDIPGARGCKHRRRRFLGRRSNRPPNRTRGGFRFNRKNVACAVLLGREVEIPVENVA